MDARHIRVPQKKAGKHTVSETAKSRHGVSESGAQKILVLIANRSRLMRELLRSLLADHADIEVVDAVEPGRDLIEHVRRYHPNCLIVDYENGGRFFNAFMPKFKDLKILAIPAKKTSSRIYWADGETHSENVTTSVDGVLQALRETRGKLHSRMIVGLQKAS
jgi:DNA-binding NarL/FixJ family response regulator